MQRLFGRVALLSMFGAVCMFAQPSRVEVVMATPGNPLRGGRALLRAVAGIRSPSAEIPALVKVEPGVYDLGGRTLEMRPFVDIEGSGQGVTMITTNADYTVLASSDAEIRELTLHNNTTTPQSNNGFDPRWSVVQVEAGNDARLTDVTIKSEGTAYGVRVIENASAKLHDVDVEIDTAEVGAFAGLSIFGTVEMTGGSVVLNQFGFAVDVLGEATLTGTSIHVDELLSNAVRTFGGTVTLVDANLDGGEFGQGIVSAFGATVVVHHSVLNGPVSEVNAVDTIVIGASQVINPGASTTAQCVASYDGTFNPVDSNCQPIP